MQTSSVWEVGWENRGLTQIWYASGTFISSYLCSRFPSESLLPRCSPGSFAAVVPLPRVAHTALSAATALLPCEVHPQTRLVTTLKDVFFPLFLTFCLYLSHLAAVIGDKGQGSRRLTKGNTSFLLAMWPSAHPATAVPSQTSFYGSHTNRRTAEYTDLHRESAKTPYATPLPAPRVEEISAKGQVHHLFSKRKSPLRFWCC